MCSKGEYKAERIDLTRSSKERASNPEVGICTESGDGAGRLNHGLRDLEAAETACRILATHSSSEKLGKMVIVASPRNLLGASEPSTFSELGALLALASSGVFSLPQALG